MVLENISIEEHIAALATKSVADRLRVIAAISGGLVEEKATLLKEPSAAYGGDDKTKIAVESGVVSSELGLEAYKKKNKSEEWKSLWGVWEESTPDNLYELIRADRGPEDEPPNFDL